MKAVLIFAAGFVFFDAAPEYRHLLGIGVAFWSVVAYSYYKNKNTEAVPAAALSDSDDAKSPRFLKNQTPM